jgi:GTP-binding protein
LPAVLRVFDVWNCRVPTPSLNRWLEHAVDRHPPPAPGGRPLRIRYMTQAKVRPPSFVLFANRPAEVPESYLRYLANGLREAFDLPGVPLRLTLRRSRNPFAGDPGKS